MKPQPFNLTQPRETVGFAACQDDRVQADVQAILAEMGLTIGHYCPIHLAGGAGVLDLVGSLLPELEVDHEHHDTHGWLLIGHEDCAAGANIDTLFANLGQIKQLFPDMVGKLVVVWQFKVIGHQEQEFWGHVYLNPDAETSVNWHIVTREAKEAARAFVLTRTDADHPGPNVLPSDFTKLDVTVIL